MAKQITQVLDAVNLGCETAHEIEAVTGLSRRHVSAYLTDLVSDGLIRRRREPGRRYSRRGSPCFLYASVGEGAS